MSCGRCHTCGGPIRTVLDGEEWCDQCQKYQRPASHGWVESLPADAADSSACARQYDDLKAMRESRRR